MILAPTETHNLTDSQYMEVNQQPLHKLIQLKPVFIWMISYLDNHSLLRFSLVNKKVRTCLAEKELYRKAAWSLSRGIPFNIFTPLYDQDKMYQKINIRFPELVLAFGSLEIMDAMPTIHLTCPIEHAGTLTVDHRVTRGCDSENKPFLAFRLAIKTPYQSKYKQQIEVIYQEKNSWKRLPSNDHPQLTLGIEKLNNPEYCTLFISRLKQLLDGKFIGVINHENNLLPYSIIPVNGPYSEYVFLI
jgi:hypothetical protein